MDVLIDYVAGAAGGVTVVLIGHPFDTIKTRLQTAPPGFYGNTADCIRKTLRKEGVGGFFKGMSSPLAGQQFFRAASFVTFHHTLKQLQNSAGAKPNEVPKFSNLIFAGSITGFIVSFIETPIDLIKTKLQIQIFKQTNNPYYRPVYNNASNCTMHMLKTYGIRALWQGWAATMIRNVPANGCFFSVNELWKHAIAKHNQISVHDLQTHHRLIAGAAAGLGYWMGAYPLDVVKSRIELQHFKSRLSWWRTVKMIYNESGWRGFYRGLGPCAVRAVFACAGMFCVADTVREVLRRHEHRVPVVKYVTESTITYMKAVPIVNEIVSLYSDAAAENIKRSGSNGKIV
mmetsp:Transcript_22286/g.22459  ORF Transcript_22286/g.22459 Transcript_22286/m.22459 type:complete len:344 (+) Transcript_22286:238-1269(+)